MEILYADLCEMGERATRENSLGIKLVPTVLNLREKVEIELEKRGTLAGLLDQWSKVA
ncbi:hypothetical protein SAMN00017405_0372 [Desulfonispora thiosulfatigenes DSM 11270]|uniref:Uncharacterized protein n=1 Tax=Desulfonispora thiosulfatigenes DSM 11270 TaxID=656914 RepID=A0A1W1VQD6_DESTI|nr:hypothetical protein [Desulfonispora thiosulfatigenes]SMB95301.1 hypothetical protein SAMN00017405_0372 [Desulfonispora thiosulfatigenes DSM 11270]